MFWILMGLSISIIPSFFVHLIFEFIYASKFWRSKGRCAHKFEIKLETKHPAKYEIKSTVYCVAM